jgi:predicted nucleic acid-binding protein
LALILDTNAISGLFADDPGLTSLLAGTDRHHLPTVVVGEYRYGLMRSRDRGVLAELLDELIEASLVLPIDLATTGHYAAVRDELRARGTPLPENDVWIAALARQHGLAVVSRDAHFDHVPQLVRRSW